MQLCNEYYLDWYCHECNDYMITWKNAMDYCTVLHKKNYSRYQKRQVKLKIVYKQKEII